MKKKYNVFREDFLEFVEYQKLSEDEDFEGVLDFLKNVDVDDFIKSNKKQETIIDELNAWRKFEKNNWQKESVREFMPFLTRGEIEEFVKNRLYLFNNDGELLSADEAFEKLFKRSILRMKKLDTKRQMLNETVQLFDEIKRRLPKDKGELLEDATRLIMNAYNKLDAQDFYNVLRNQIPLEISKKLGKLNSDIVVDFVFDTLTDYKLRSLPDYDNFSGITNRLKARWREFLRKAVFHTKKPITKDDVFKIALNVFNSVRQDFLTNKQVFKFSFQRSLTKAINKELSAFDFQKQIRAIIRVHGRQAFRSGIEMFGLDPKDFRLIENLVIRRLNNQANKYLQQFTTKLTIGSFDLAKNLLASTRWSNRTLDKFFEIGKLTADRNGLYQWVYGDTKHCPTCLKANEQRHRLKHWWQSGILPQNHGSRDLICGGFYCKCQLVRVTGKARGRLDRIPVL